MKENTIYRLISSNAPRKRVERRHVSLVIFIFAMVTTFSFIFTFNMSRTNAANLALFRPGNIMSDEVMSDNTTMTEEQIQAFLKSKNSCNDTNIGKANNYPNVHYHIENGHFVCMADELFDNNETGEKETAAHIIWQAGQDYNVNPQVLIVLLQKEQGLVTDTWPNHIQYRSATGYGCPDTAACNSRYYGFRNQVRNAAALFHTVLTGGWTNYPLGNNYIQYNPSKSCGGSVVNVENLATSALYRYTPYQPNAGALQAYTGTAPCGAYGNRNFFIYFSDWFGDPTRVTEQPSEQQPEEQPQETQPSEPAESEQPAEQEEEQPEEVIPALSNEATEIYKKLDKEKIKVLGEVKDEILTIKDEKNKEQKALIFEQGLAYVDGNETKILSGEVYTSWISQRIKLGNIILVATTSDSGTKSLECEKGYLVGKDGKNYRLVEDVIYKKYSLYESILGVPVNDRQKNTRTGMEWQQFENGYVVGNDKKGWFISYGKSREVWTKTNYEQGILGFPTSDIQENKKTGMKWQNYDNGCVVGNDQKGWFISYGKSREVWARTNYEQGILGFPTSDIQENKKTGMKWQVYENGYVVGNDKKGWFISYGKSREAWARNGCEQGVLGFPTSDIQENKKTGMKWQVYENGYVVGNDQKGWFISYGKIREKWAKAGFESGRYGWPKSDVISGYQRYSGGIIYK